MGERKLQRALGLLGTLALFVAAALPVQGIAAAYEPPATGPASNSVLTKPPPDPGQLSTMPRPAGTQSKTALSPKALTAGGTWSWQNPLPDGNPLNAISCPSTTTCFAGSSDGRVLATTNGGSTWAAQTTGVSTSINAISCASTTACVAVGDFGAAVNTSNGGTNWTKVMINGGNFLAGVGCPTVSICFAVGALGAILKSADGGANWVALTSGTINHLFAISCPSTSVCVSVGVGQVIDGTSDGGVTWTVTSPFSPPSTALFGVSCSSTTTCVAVGAGGAVYATVGAPTGWIYNGATTGALLIGVSCAKGMRCLASGVDGSVYFIWFAPGNPAAILGHASTGAMGALFAISCPSTASCFAAGDFGTVVATSNGGTGWTQQSPGVFTDLHGISCPSTSVCVAVGDQGNVAVTADGGTTWTPQRLPNANFYTNMFGVSCPTTSNCFAVGSGFAAGANAFATTDGGVTWSTQTTPTVNALNGVSCPSTTTCFAVGLTGVIVTTSDAGAHWVAQTSGLTSTLTGISCLTSSACFAVGAGGKILATTNAGVSWTAQGSLTSDLNSIACASASVCFAVGSGKMFGTSDGGTTWTDQSPGSAATDTFLGVSCPSTTTCFAVGGQGPNLSAVFATANGLTWAGQTAAGTKPLLGVSCPSTTVCYAAGQAGLIDGTKDGGATAWQKLGPSGAQFDLLGVSCPSSTTCFALVSATAQILSTTNGGRQWFQSFAAPTTAVAISCPSISTCFAVSGGGRIYVTTNGGASWIQEMTATTQLLISVSCPSNSSCYAVTTGGLVTKTTDGVNWSAPAQLSTATSLSAISCPGSTTCFATDAGTPGQVFATTNGGTSWALSFNLSTDPQAGLVGPFTAISCPSTTACYASGASGLMAATSDGGVKWRTDNIPSSAQLTGVSCPSVSTCYASADDSTILYTNDYGGTWTAQYANVNSVYSGISCPTTTACFAVGTSGVITATTTAGAAWTRPRPVGPTTLVRGMSCTSNSDCYAAAYNNILVTHNGGSTWTSQLTPGTDQLDAISCPAANTCFAVGWPGTIYFTGDGGTTWTRQANSLYGSDTTFLGVSCASTTTCVAVGTQGTILSTSNGSTWAAETSGTTQLLIGVSCPSTYTCVAVGAIGLTMTRSGGSWQAYPSGTTKTLRGVSCPSATVCYAVGSGGTVLLTQNRGANWTAQASGTVHDLYGVSCTQTTVCLAVGNFGTAVITLDGSSWSLLNVPTGNALRAAVFEDLNHAWVAGFGGTILANPAITPGCASVTESAAPASPATAGTFVTFTGSASCPNPNPLYQFWILAPGSTTWTVLQAYSTTATATWNTTGLAAGTYTYTVWVHDQSSTGIFCGSLGCFDAFSPATAYTLIITPCTAVTESAAPPLTTTVGTSVTFTASASGCPRPLYQFWILAPGSSAWTILQAYSPLATVTWNTTGLAAGSYTYTVWAQDSGRSGTTCGSLGCFDVYFPATAYTLTTTPTTTCPWVTESASPASTATSGTTVTFTAITLGCPNPRYQFWLLAPGSTTWTAAQPYSSTATFTWNTAGLPAGSYTYAVWVRDASSSGLLCNNLGCFDASGPAYTYTLTSAASTVCTAVTELAQPAPPAPAGTSVLFTASATCSHPNPLFQFWILAPGSTTWTILQPYSGGSMVIWNTNGLPLGDYKYTVWAKDTGSTGSSCGNLGCFDVFSPATTYTLTGKVCTSVTETAAPPATAPVGTSVTFTATSICASPNPLYQFWMLYPGSSTWTIGRPYSVGSTFNWDTFDQNMLGLPAGTYSYTVWVRDAGSTGSSCNNLGCFDAAFPVTSYTLTSTPPCTSVTESAAPASTATTGTTVTFTATPSGCANPRYQFWILAPGSTTWTIARPYAPLATFTWNTTGLLAGSYRYTVWVRDMGSAGTSSNSLGSFDAYAPATAYTLTSTPPCTSVTETAAPPATAVHGTTVTFTAVASSCANPRYQFWILAPGSTTWTIAQPYSPSTTFTWNTTGLPAGSYTYTVWARDAGSAGTSSNNLGTFDAYAPATAYTLT